MNIVSTYFNDGLKCLDKASYNEAIVLLRQVLVHYPNNAIAYNNIGIAQTHIGINQRNKYLLESSIQYFQKAIAIIELIPGYTYPIALKNLKWAKEELNKLV
ncbi:hypothetical protein [uncultured Planktosalinus sp.]|uniref:hypothetical protein n=1 Tax=uncultured Planktosalinus sp. TaxID=1810935 RepID=UPI0030DC8C2C